MKKLNKINLKLDKEVISSLSGNEMNDVKGGTYGKTLTCPIIYSNNGIPTCVIQTEPANECAIPTPATVNDNTCKSCGPALCIVSKNEPCSIEPIPQTASCGCVITNDFFCP